jgi:hypothetical protein
MEKRGSTRITVTLPEQKNGIQMKCYCTALSLCGFFYIREKTEIDSKVIYE